MYGKCARDITHVPEMCLVETCQANSSSPFNVPDMFLPVSRCLHPQCDVPIGFALVMAGECFQKIGELTDEVIHNDLLVRMFPKFSFRLLTGILPFSVVRIILMLIP